MEKGLGFLIAAACLVLLLKLAVRQAAKQRKEKASAKASDLFTDLREALAGRNVDEGIKALALEIIRLDREWKGPVLDLISAEPYTRPLLSWVVGRLSEGGKEPSVEEIFIQFETLVGKKTSPSVLNGFALEIVSVDPAMSERVLNIYEFFGRRALSTLLQDSKGWREATEGRLSGLDIA